MRWSFRTMLSVSVLVSGLLIPAAPDALAATGCAPHWTITSTGNPDGGLDSLHGMASVSSTDAWAVGSAGTHSLAEHWDGSTWHVASTPTLKGSDALASASAAAGDDVWAVGYVGDATLAEHWDGSMWSVVPTPNAGTLAALNGVSVESGADAWAVGYSLAGGVAKTLTEHWDGVSWTVVPSPSVGSIGSRLMGVESVSATRAWAVGGYFDSHDSIEPLLEKWNGSTWKVTASAHLGAAQGGIFTSIASSSGQLWAAGGVWDNTGFEKSLIERFDGSTWTVEATPSPSVNQDELDGVAVAASGDIWAVGVYTSSSGVNSFPLVEHFDGTTWSLVGVPTIGSEDQLRAIAPQPGGFLAVGGPNDGYNSPTSLAERICPVQVLDGGAQPVRASTDQGATVAWSIPSEDATAHSITDASRLGLFDSGILSPGNSFTYPYQSAGTYAVADSATAARSTVLVPVGIDPHSGHTSTTFTVTWSASAPPADDVFDVQIRPPGAGPFIAWRTGVKEVSDAFSASDPAWAGLGTYLFRARLRDGKGHHSGWSPKQPLTVK